nr:hypothetical protein [Mycolicibacterium insubricum]
MNSVSMPDHRPRVALLGSGELGAEQVAAFTRLGVEVVAVDSRPGGAAARIADAAEVVTLTDPEALTALLRRVAPGYVVSATDAVAAGALAAFEDDGATVAPSARNVRLALDREGLRRLAADELGLPTVPFWFAASATELAAIAEHAASRWWSSRWSRCRVRASRCCCGPPTSNRPGSVRCRWPAGSPTSGCWPRPSSRSTTS